MEELNKPVFVALVFHNKIGKGLLSLSSSVWFNLVWLNLKREMKALGNIKVGQPKDLGTSLLRQLNLGTFVLSREDLSPEVSGHLGFLGVSFTEM